jgi:acyl-CoA thioesterase-2
MSLFDAILAPHSKRWDDDLFMAASLDHCMWFHRDVQADEWLLYDIDSPIAHGGRRPRSRLHLTTRRANSAFPWFKKD